MGRIVFIKMKPAKNIKIIGISGGLRERNTNSILRTVLDANGCDYELILLKDKNIKPCAACGGCFYTHKCVVKDDMQELYDKLIGADIIVFGCPAYFANVTALMKGFIDRCLPLYLSEKLKGKKAALLSVGNFKKGEVRFLDGFDIDKEIKKPEGRKILSKSVSRCLDILRFFCSQHLQMTIVGSVAVIGSDPESKQKELVKLGKKLVL